MDTIMEKIGALIDKLNHEGVEFSTGEYAIVCNDGVLILEITEQECGVIAINNRLNVDYDLGITDDEIAELKMFESAKKVLEGCFGE